MNQSGVDFISELGRRLEQVSGDARERCFLFVRRCGVMGSTLAFGSVDHGFESEHRSFSHHGASAFSKLRSLAKCSLVCISQAFCKQRHLVTNAQPSTATVR